MRAEVAGKHQLAAIRPQFDDAGAKDVPGIAEGDLDAVEDAGAAVIVMRPQQVDGIGHVLFRVQRLLLRFAMRAPAVEALGIAFR